MRDVELLSSALAMPRTTFEGRLLHADLFDQAAADAFHISQNDAFVDGNKRTALAAALVFLDLNGVELEAPKDSLYRLMMDSATGRRSKADIARTLGALREKSRGRKSGRPRK
jgi:death-on-curing protein